MVDIERQISTLSYDEVMEFTERVVSKGEFSFSGLGIEEVAGEICTASFLNRDKEGNFFFADRSFQEYFVASRFYRYLEDSDRNNLLIEMLAMRSLEQKIILFLTQLDEADLIRQRLRGILTGDYTPQVSENTLRILYWSGRIRSGMEKIINDPGLLRGIFHQRIPSGAQLPGARLKGAELEAVDMSGADFSGADLTGANFKRARLYDVNFRGARLTKSDFEGSLITRADFREAALNNAVIRSASLVDCDFTGVTSDGIVFDRNEVDEKTKGLSAIGRVRAIDMRPVVQRAHAAGVNVVACSSDGELCASGGADGLIVIHRIEDGRILQVLEGHTRKVTSVDFSPNGVLLVSCGEDSMLRLWSVNEGSPRRTLEGHTSAVRSVSFSPNGKYIASAGDDRTVRLWSAGDGQILRIFPEHADAVNAVHFSSDNRLLASGSSDGSVRFWDTGSGRSVNKIDMPSDRLTQLEI